MGEDFGKGRKGGDWRMDVGGGWRVERTGEWMKVTRGEEGMA